MNSSPFYVCSCLHPWNIPPPLYPSHSWIFVHDPGWQGPRVCTELKGFSFFSFQLPFSTSLLVKFRQKKKEVIGGNKKKPVHQIFELSWLPPPPQKKTPKIDSKWFDIVVVCLWPVTFYISSPAPPTLLGKFSSRWPDIYMGLRVKWKRGGGFFFPSNWTRSNRIESNRMEMDEWMNEWMNEWNCKTWLNDGERFWNNLDSEKIPWIKWCEDNVCLCMCGRERERVLFIAGQARLWA